MDREYYSLTTRSLRRMKKRMLRDVFEENLFINDLGGRKSRRPKANSLFFKGAVLFAALIGFSVYRNSDGGEYHALPALPLASYMTIAPDRLPRAPLIVAEGQTGGLSDYRPLLSQNDFSLRNIFGLKVRAIVIDPGHGGEDPGTSGEFSTREKDLTLDIARRLLRRLSRYEGYTIALTREQDETLSLEERIEFANSRRADLFVSIHVNNIPDKPYSIVETYYFGPNNDRNILALVEKENSGSPYTVGDFKAMMLKMTDTLKHQEGRTLARAIQRNLFDSMRRGNDRIYDYGVKTAPFVVLLGVDMPSVLTEVTCLSSREEEIKLRSEAYREEIAGCIEAGIVEYLQIKNNPKPSEV